MSNERRSDERPADRAVEGARRAASREEPPARIDATILAAARAEVQRQQRPQRTVPRAARRAWWTQWQPLSAAASVAGLAFLVVQLIPRDGDVARPPTLERQEPAPAEADVAPAAGSTESSVREEASSAPVAPQAKAREAPESVRVPPATPAAAPSTLPPAGAGADNAAAMSAETPVSTGVAAREAPRALPAQAPPPAPPTPDEWAQRIAALYQAGSPAAAAAELRAFRETYPGADQYLPADLRPWAVTVRD